MVKYMEVNFQPLEMATLIEAACSKTSNYSLTFPLQSGENMVQQRDNVCSDYEYSASCSSYSSGIGSNNDINLPVNFKHKSNSSVDQKKIEVSRFISEHRRICHAHLDNIDAAINNHLNNTGQELLNRKYFMLQNELKIQKKISETKEEIHKIRNSIYNETVEQLHFFENLKIFYLVAVLVICASSVSILCC